MRLKNAGLKAAPLQRILLTLSLLGAPFLAHAISNIENQRPGLPKEGFSGTTEISLNGKTGDKKEKDYAFAAKLNYRNNNNQYLIISSAEYGTTRDVKDADEAFAHSRWTHQLNSVWSSEAFLQWEEDEFANLQSRFLVGGGGRFLAASKADVYSLSIGLGAFRELETLDLVSIQQDTNLWRINTYYSYTHKINDKTTIASTAYIQPSAEDFDDLRALFTLSLTVKMTQALALKVAYQAKHDSQPAQNLSIDPPIDNHKTNTEYSTSLVYRF